MYFIRRRLETKKDRDIILPYWNMHVDFLEKGIFPSEDFCLLLDSPYPLKIIRSKKPLENIKIKSDCWEINSYCKDNPQLYAKDKIIPPNNICGAVCCKEITSSKLSQIIADTIMSLFNERCIVKNEYNELFIGNLKIAGLDSFQKTNDFGKSYSVVSFLLFLSDVTSYSQKLKDMAKKSVYGSLFSKMLDADSLKKIEENFFEVFKSKSFEQPCGFL